METKEIRADVKNEVTKAVERLSTLRDEARLHLHLASLDAKKEWNETLEPKVAELQSSAHQLTESSKVRVQEVLRSVEDFVAKLRGKTSAS